MHLQTVSGLLLAINCSKLSRICFGHFARSLAVLKGCCIARAQRSRPDSSVPAVVVLLDEFVIPYNNFSCAARLEPGDGDLEAAEAVGGLDGIVLEAEDQLLLRRIARRCVEGTALAEHLTADRQVNLEGAPRCFNELLCPMDFPEGDLGLARPQRRTEAEAEEGVALALERPC